MCVLVSIVYVGVCESVCFLPRYGAPDPELIEYQHWGGVLVPGVTVAVGRKGWLKKVNRQVNMVTRDAELTTDTTLGDGVNLIHKVNGQPANPQANQPTTNQPPTPPHQPPLTQPTKTNQPTTTNQAAMKRVLTGRDTIARVRMDLPGCSTTAAAVPRRLGDQSSTQASSSSAPSAKASAGAAPEVDGAGPVAADDAAEDDDDDVCGMMSVLCCFRAEAVPKPKAKSTPKARGG